MYIYVWVCKFVNIFVGLVFFFVFGSGHLSWQDILKYSKMRKNYVSKYIELLKANPKKKSISKNKEIQELDRQLDPKIIIQWR